MFLRFSFGTQEKQPLAKGIIVDIHMKPTSKKVIPILFVGVAIFYLIFGFSLEQRRMIADEKGWDPGSKAMPIGIGILMLGLSIYLTLKEVKSEDTEEKPLDPGSVKLIGLTITMAVLYILGFRYVGFVLSTQMLLFTLVYFNGKGDIAWNMMPNFLIGASVCNGFVLIIYSTGRYMIRSLFLLGKQSGLEILTSRLFITGTTFIALAGLMFVLWIVLNRTLKSEHSRNLITPLFIATGTTEFLYLIFKQIFWVSLTQGFIDW